MKHKYLIQCKKIIINNKKYNKYIKFTLADKLSLYVLSKKLKKEKNIDNITFEEFILLCKHNKMKATLRIESKYSTLFVDIISMNSHTLYNTLIKIINDIENHNNEDNYKNIDSILHYLKCTNVILFDCFVDMCETLDIKISIE